MALKIPSIFTAVDKFTAPVERMQRAMGSFGSQAESSAARIERRFSKLSSSASKVALKTGAMGLAIAAPLGLAVNKAMDYEDKLANLKALTGLSGKEFEKFTNNIEASSEATKRSKLTVVDAYTAIANNMPALLQNADALKAVTDSSILLSKAGRGELGPTAESLTTILNQYGKGAEYAAKAVDVLAAGSVAGSSEINQTAEAIQKFGAMAAAKNISIPESVALIELGSRFEKGAEAGVKFRNIIGNISNATVLPASATSVMKKAGVNMQMLIDKSIPLNDKLLEMQKILKITGGVTQVFGKENEAMATGVLQNASAYQTMLDQVSKSGEAQRMAAENGNTFKEKLEQSKAAMDNLMIAAGDGLIPALTDLAKAATPLLKSFGAFIKENPGIVKLAAGFALIMMAVSGIAGVVSTVSTVIAGFASIAPIISGIGAFMANYIVPSFQIFFALLTGAAELAAGALGIGFGAFMAILLAIVGVFISIYSHWDMITKAFQDGGMVGGIKAIGAALLDVILWPLQKIFEMLSHIPGATGEAFKGFGSGLENFRADLGLTETPAVSTKVAQEQATNSRAEQTVNNNKNVTVDFKNLPKGTIVDGVANQMMPNMTSTMSW